MRFTLILCEGTSTRIGLYNKQVTTTDSGIGNGY